MFFHQAHPDFPSKRILMTKAKKIKEEKEEVIQPEAPKVEAETVEESAEKVAFRKNMEDYAVRNPEKFKLKEAALLAELNKLS